ncbi:DUF1285 domain-containing protein [Marinospirillum insulare]|uniref:DUF1285 domain-containing protein n=1 Tax=Marinospirillum insulare TaxID=217169 RepID=A0ABQ6A039_9GAMM|nr:DUF1285 domain-containing protein [Marinospirillum insulare]GLR64276.1 hypothetical protein GCM10007878_17140 [Marinospirillum insulare]
MSTSSVLLQLASKISLNPHEKGLPPIHEWQPEQVVDIDLSIDHQGQWFHQGQPFIRTELVRLFSTLLRLEEDAHYYLITPVEKVLVKVAEVPFLIVAAQQTIQKGQPTLILETNLSDSFQLNADHPLRVVTQASGEPRPYVRVRDQLEARILPQVFYQLVDLAETRQENQKTCLYLTSASAEFQLGCFD